MALYQWDEDVGRANNYTTKLPTGSTDCGGRKPGQMEYVLITSARRLTGPTGR